jgi:lipopolysaccharide/colanic/teichoic acid biosynthesis glycosyltransferase
VPEGTARADESPVAIDDGGLPKRLFDLAVCLAALPFLSVLFLAIGLVIWKMSPGPVFYLGLRTGQHGKRFRMIKFRTMVKDAERLGGSTTGLNDPRVFPFGRVLRKYKLDELPQVFNVIRGEMSLVGPRPEVPMYTDRYEGDELLILEVKPGITDFSSIEFSSLDEIVGEGDADRVFEEKVLKRKNGLRVRYARERSFLVDMAIIARTVGAILKKADS